ncbi:MAG TPA: hypothetical protein VKG38_15400 [Solirubrobacteraceae bacterium]|nr:hypothetical protein [Solirubrobacteraceae bacterium]
MASAGVLPASGTAVLLREPTGADELFVLEGAGPAAATALALAARLVCDNAGRAIDWATLPAVELAAAALLIRRSWLGDLLVAETMCPGLACGEQIDVRVSIDAYLEHHRPSPCRGASESEPGWLTLTRTDVLFRIPTVGDLIETLDGSAGASSLARSCIRPPEAPAAVRRRIDRALDALAPRLDGELGGTCPGCGETIELRFEPIGYVLEELRDASSEVLGQVHELALAYHWSEESILAVPRRRRLGYVTMIRGELALT